MDKLKRIAVIGLWDIILMNLALLLAVIIQFEGHLPMPRLESIFHIIIIVTAIKLFIYNKFGLYNSLWEFASIEELMKVVGAVTAGTLLSLTYYFIAPVNNMYIGVFIVAYVFEIALIGGNRFSYRIMRRMKQQKSIFKQDPDQERVLIVGTGSTATLVATEIKARPQQYGKLVGFIDDNDQHLGRVIAGVKVLGNRYDILSIVKRQNINEIILAIPTASHIDTRDILEECKRTGAKVKIVPGITEVIDGKVSMNAIRDVEIEDLLGRDPINLNCEEIATYLTDKIVMVTGGGGSIGSELCRQIAKFKPKKLVILDIYENNAYDIQNELKRQYGDKLNLDVLIGSVRDKGCINRMMKEVLPDTVFHAAAHKHVPLMERSPKEAIKNNIVGTLNVAKAAEKFGVERFVLISTDKAVNPTNVMGATKRMCEMVIQSMSKVSKTKFVAVRFGNVLGSNGSVIPLFKKQISEGGPITVTHKDIIRYFMTIPEAAQLVIQAGGMAKGGEIFILEMGDPVRIYDLAEDLIRLSGLTPHEDIKIEVTGLRPGEKLYEELLMDEEGMTDTKYDKIHIGAPSDLDFKMVEANVKGLYDMLALATDEEVIQRLETLVPTYKRQKTTDTIIIENVEEAVQ